MDLMSLLVILIIWIIFASKSSKSSGKRGSNKSHPHNADKIIMAQKKGNAAEQNRHSLFKKQSIKQDIPADDSAFSQEIAAGSDSPQSLRFKDVTPEEFDSASEGDDPCHPIPGSGKTLTNASFNNASEEERSDMDWSYGIVMSELIKRPAQRRQERRSRRPSHFKQNRFMRTYTDLGKHNE